MNPVVKNNRVSSLCFSTHFKMEDYLPKPQWCVTGNMQEMMQLKRGKLQQQTGGFSGEGPLNVHLGRKGKRDHQLEGTEGECQSLINT